MKSTTRKFIYSSPNKTKSIRQNMHSSKNFVFVSFLFALLIFSNSMTAFGQNNLSNPSNGPTTTPTNNIPPLSVKWGLNGENFQDLKTRLVTLPVSFNPDGSQTVVNDPNFSFTTDLWPLIGHGASLNTAFGASSMQPSSVAITLKTVLNPTQATNINNMQLGATYQLPLSVQDAGQLRNFLVSSDIPSGHYLVDVSSNYGNLDAVYSGKLFIPSTTPVPPASTLNTVTKIVTNVKDICPKGQTLKDGLCSGLADNGKCPPGQKISNDICSGPPTKGCDPGLTKIGDKCVSNPTPVEICPDGSEPPENGQCVSDSTPVIECANGQPPQPNGTCADGSQPKNKQTCANGQPPQPNGTCADGSIPKDDKTCPANTTPSGDKCISQPVTKNTCNDGQPPQPNGTCADGSIPRDEVICPDNQELEGDFCVSDQIDQCKNGQYLIGKECVGPPLTALSCPNGQELDNEKCVPIEEVMYDQNTPCPEDQLTSDGQCATDPSIDEAESDSVECPGNVFTEDGQCMGNTDLSPGNEGNEGDPNDNEGNEGDPNDNEGNEGDPNDNEGDEGDEGDDGQESNEEDMAQDVDEE